MVRAHRLRRARRWRGRRRAQRVRRGSAARTRLRRRAGPGRPRIRCDPRNDRSLTCRASLYNAASSPIGFSMLAIVGVCQARLGRAARLAPVRLVVERDGRPTHPMSAISVTRSSSTGVCSAWMMLPPRRAELTSPAPSSTLRWRDTRDTRPSETLAQPPPSGGACCGPAPWPPPPPKPPPPNGPASPLVADDDVAWICVAVIVPLELLVPCTITVSPGWIAPAVVEAVRVILECLVVLTRMVLPSESLT